MKLVTVVTHSEGYFPWLLQSCERFGASLTVLGWGEKWNGYAWRLKLMSDYLSTLKPTEVVCFIDGYDVILLRPLQELQAVFLELKQNHAFKIAVALERPLTKMTQLGAYISFGACNNRLLNAGTYIGFVQDLQEIIRNVYNVNPDFQADDQQLLLKYCRKSPQDIYIDVHSKMFLTLINPTQDINLQAQALSGNKPCIFHGAYCTDMNMLIRALGYTMSVQDRRQLVAYNKQMLRTKTMYYARLTKHIFLFVFGIFLLIALAVTYRAALAQAARTLKRLTRSPHR